MLSDLTGYKHIIPTHQGRASEKILATISVKEGDIIPSNSHFDTTRANFEFAQSNPIDLLCEEGLDLLSPAPFKGNVDLEITGRPPTANKGEAEILGDYPHILIDKNDHQILKLIFQVQQTN